MPQVKENLCLGGKKGYQGSLIGVPEELPGSPASSDLWLPDSTSPWQQEMGERGDEAKGILPFSLGSLFWASEK